MERARQMAREEVERHRARKARKNASAGRAPLPCEDSVLRDPRVCCIFKMREGLMAYVIFHSSDVGCADAAPVREVASRVDHGVIYRNEIENDAGAL
jgi:hypothetical protein